jgi:hypothetical protein
MSALIVLLNPRPRGRSAPSRQSPPTRIRALADASIQFGRTLIAGWMLLAWVLILTKEAMRGIAWLTGATADLSA